MKFDDGVPCIGGQAYFHVQLMSLLVVIRILHVVRKTELIEIDVTGYNWVLVSDS